MAQLDARRVERDGVGRELGRCGEKELGPSVDEALDEPGGRHPVHVRARPGDPAPTAKPGEIERPRLLTPHGFWTSGAHGNGLLETPHFGAAGGLDEGV